MGSYLTIVNDTETPWLCKVGPDVAAIKWITIGLTVVAAAAAILVTGGILAPHAVGVLLIAQGLSIWAVPAAAFAMASVVAGAGFVAGSAPTLIGVTVAKSITNNMMGKNYDLILPRQQKRYGKMSLSLWRQSACIKVSTNKKKVFMETLYMRPIFSGSTKNSNRDHSIQWWLNKDGTTRQVIPMRPEAPPNTEGQVNPTSPPPMVPKRPEAPPSKEEQVYPPASPPNEVYDGESKEDTTATYKRVQSQPTTDRALEEDDTTEYATTE